MYNNVKNTMTTQNPARWPLFWLLLAATIFIGFLLAGRLVLDRAPMLDIQRVHEVPEYRGKTFMFLAWNLFLAWIPYFIGLWLAQKNQSRWAFCLWLVLWLLFFPNAPYIVTDLLHLRPRPPVPFWYDLMLLFSTALTGLTLGLVSLYEVHLALAKRMEGGRAWMLVGLLVALGSFGVWLGRYQRWNSWDAMINPGGIVQDLWRILTSQQGLLQAIGVSTLFFGMLGFGYGLLYVLLKSSERINLER